MAANMAFTGLFLMIIVLAIIFAIFVAAVSKFGFGAVFKTMLFVGVVILLGSIPLLFWTKTSSYQTFHVAPTADVAAADSSSQFLSPESYEQQQVIVTPEWEPSSGADIIDTSDANETHQIAARQFPPTPVITPTSVGEVVGGDSKVWGHAFAEEHVADLYSSGTEAAMSLARRCGVILDAETDSLSKQMTVSLNLPSGRWDEQSSVAFRAELRRAAPHIRIVDKSDDATVELELKEGTPSGSGELRTYRASFTHEGDEFDIVARFVSKPWVKNDLDFRLSSEAPKRYLVALGNNGEFEEAAIDAAANALVQDVDYYIRHNSHRYGMLSSSEFPELARVAAISLTLDKFTQTFDFKSDGSRVDKPVTREALLIDCTRKNLHAAIDAAKRGVEYQPNRIATPVTTVQRRSRLKSESLLAMFAILFVCAAGLKGVSRFFDGPSV